MAKSTNMLADIASVISNGPAAATLALSIVASGAIMDYQGNTALAQETLQEAKNMLTTVKAVTDSTDTAELALINGLLAVLSGTSNPSTQVLTDTATAVAAGANSASQAKAISATGPIQDYVGMLTAVQVRFQQLLGQLTALYNNTDTGTDGTNRTLLNQLVTVLV